MLEKIGTSQATRRGFLGAAALTAASYKRVLGANDRVGVGFIGFGLIGKQHIADFKKFNDVDLVGMCDVYKPRLEAGLEYMASTKAKGYSDFRKMYENKDIQGVVVATPDHWHALLTIMACAAGKDVYVEKPMTVFIDEGKWMIEAKKKYNRVIVVGTQRRQGKGVAEAKKVIESGVLGKISTVRCASNRNIFPGFGKTPVENPPSEIDYEMWLGPAPKKPYQNHRALYHFRWFWDYSGGQLTNLGAHTLDQVLWCMNAKGPELVMSTGGRFALEDDGETPDTQDVIWKMPGGWTVNYAIREANGMRGDAATRGQLYMGTKGNLILSGGWEVVPENKIDPVNDIPRFQGHPIGGPVYTDVKPTPWMQASKGGVESDARYGTGGEDTMAMNERDWLNSIRTRNRPLCDVEDGQKVNIMSHLGNLSLRTGKAIHWDPEKQELAGADKNDKEIASYFSRPYRAPWDGVLKSLVKV